MFSVCRIIKLSSLFYSYAGRNLRINIVSNTNNFIFYHENNKRLCGSHNSDLKPATAGKSDTQNEIIGLQSFEKLPDAFIETERDDQKSEISKELIHKDDPDKFGILSGTTVFTNKFDNDSGDKAEEEFIGEQRRYLTTKKYADIIKGHLKSKRIKDALDVLEIRMSKEDRAKPESYIYNLLIAGCGSVGFTKKAFQLYNDMKKRNLKVTGGTYTSLFNACANSPWSKDGIQRANHLREIMIEKGYIPNITNYNAMIKAFGRCGDLQTAFTLVDEMIDKKLNVPISTMNFLLQACISDKKAGFRHALHVWRKILLMKKKPDIYSFNLMLQCVRDCGLGELRNTKLLFDNISQNPRNENNSHNERFMGSSTENTSLTSLQTPHIEINNNLVPNLLSIEPSLGNIIEIKDITHPEHRLLLLGGASGFLKEMYNYKAVPNIKTYTQLLQLIPSTTASEISFLKLLKKTGDKVDVCFFNMLMKRRVIRFEYKSAKDVLNMIKSAGLKPDILTYGILAMTCETKYEARDLLDDMSDAGYRPNIEILGSMLHAACKKISFGYVHLVTEIILNEDIEPNKEIFEVLETFYQKCSKCNRTLQNNTYCEDLKYINEEYFTTLFPRFANRYKSWLDQIKQKYPSCQHHPWDQFRKPLEEGFEGIKEFERKKKIRKRFIRAIS